MNRLLREHGVLQISVTHLLSLGCFLVNKHYFTNRMHIMIDLLIDWLHYGTSAQKGYSAKKCCYTMNKVKISVDAV